MVREPGGRDGSDATVTPRVGGVPRLVRAVSLLLLAVGCPALLWTWFEYTANGTFGALSVLLPAVCCAFFASVALVLTALGGSQKNLAPLFGSIMARTMFPMAVCMVTLTSQPVLAQQGLLWKFLAFYLLALTAETLLAVLMLQQCRSHAASVMSSPHHGYR